MPYTPQTWHDEPIEDTPITAARLTYMEAGIATAQAAAEAGGGSLTDNGNGTWTAATGVADNGNGTWTA